MIVPMKKVRVFCLARHRDEALSILRIAGVVHLTPQQIPTGTNLDASRQAAQAARDDIERLSRLSPDPAGPPEDASPDALLGAYRGARERAGALEQERVDLLRHLETLAPFGDFDPATLRAVADAGHPVRLLRLPADAAAPAGSVLHILHRERKTAWAVQIGEVPRPGDAEEIPIPDRSPASLRARLDGIAAEVAGLERVGSRAAAALPLLRRHLRGLDESAEFLAATLGLASHGDILVLGGFFPAAQTERLRRLAAAEGWGIQITDPDPGDDPPTLIHNPAWIRPIETVLKAIGIVPGYREIDISAVFLVFFSLFFAMLVGDAGYGAVFLGLTLLARRKMPKAPPEPFRMLTITSVATILWGFLTGTLFGVSFPSAPLAGWAASDEKVMHFCFLVGAVHLTIAHVWSAFLQRNRFTALAQLGWTATTWTMYFMACQMVLGRPAPGGVGWLFLSGVVLIVLFMTPPREFKSQWFNHVMLPLSLVSNFVDVISYLRLFAVGFAGLAMASTFNQMAQAGSGFWAGVAGVIILFVGHTLNITLAAMGVLVHGVRLNTLEFSSHIGNQWSGRPYEPFALQPDGAADEPSTTR